MSETLSLDEHMIYQCSIFIRFLTSFNTFS